jgi:1-hydroxycarotenoid 3,4-desaturase
MRAPRVIVIGAGIGGLATATRLAHAGCDVTVLERQQGPGGKMRVVDVGEAGVDAGPTVLTMRWVFDELFDDVGTRLDQWLTLERAQVLARHAWDRSPTLDLHADLEASVDAVAQFAGAREARAFRAFHAEAQRVYEVLREPFLRSPKPGAMSLSWRIGPGRLDDLFAIRPFATLWSVLERHFADPRLQQLYGRYATYCGSSPYAAPATLMLVAHVEQSGVWLVPGGMHQVAATLARLARSRGADVRYGSEVTRVTQRDGRVSGVVLADGSVLPADTVVCNADPAALAAGLYGTDVARKVPGLPRAERSLSALTWCLRARTSGLPLHRHNVFFSRDYAAEFRQIFREARLPEEPTVYVCAQDRGDDFTAPAAPERLLCLVNAPAGGDAPDFDEEACDRCEALTFRHLERLGLTVERTNDKVVRTTPRDFHRLFPGTGGAIYGRASHGWRASFLRPGARTSLPGLYLAGGSTHPGPGVPMAALSGRLAAASVVADLASTWKSSRMAMPGGISTR